MGEGATKTNVLRPPDSCHVVCLKREKGQAQVLERPDEAGVPGAQGLLFVALPFQMILKKSKRENRKFPLFLLLTSEGGVPPALLWASPTHPSPCFHPSPILSADTVNQGGGGAKRTMLEHNKGWICCVELMSEQWMNTELSVKLDGADN